MVHRDLKPENIMVNPETLDIKIIDFGLSAFYNDIDSLKTRVGTPYYVAPEVLDKNYGKEWDMWSIGITTYILLTGVPPIHATTLPELFRRIKNWDLRYMNSDFRELSEESYNFVRKLLRVDVKKRMTPKRALKHKWIRQESVKDTELSKK